MLIVTNTNVCPKCSSKLYKDKGSFRVCQNCGHERVLDVLDDYDNERIDVFKK